MIFSKDSEILVTSLTTYNYIYITYKVYDDGETININQHYFIFNGTLVEPCKYDMRRHVKKMVKPTCSID